jgi:hypothetical protein
VVFLAYYPVGVAKSIARKHKLFNNKNPRTIVENSNEKAAKGEVPKEITEMIRFVREFTSNI